jgi:hypothetical protein
MFLNRNRRTLRSLSAAAMTLARAKSFVHPSLAQRHERKAQQIEESAQIQAVTGGITFQTSLPIDRCFEAVANCLKRNGHEIQAANKDAGTICFKPSPGATLRSTTSKLPKRPRLCRMP